MPGKNVQPPFCHLPDVHLPDNINALVIAEEFSRRLPALDHSDFTDDALWYDLFAVSGRIHTFYSAITIAAAWKHLATTRGIKSFQIITEQVQTKQHAGKPSWVDVRFHFKTTREPIICGLAMLSLVPNGEKGGSDTWRIWMMRTLLDQLEEKHGNVDRLNPTIPISPTKASQGSGCNIRPPYELGCVVVGAGQAGLAVAGTLKALGISYVAIDRNQRVGDNWLCRYDSVKTHTPREYCHLPFERTFSDRYPERLSKYDLAKGYQEWVDRYDINVWLSTELVSGQWDKASEKWTLKVKQRNGTRIVSCSHVVLATGIGVQTPFMPSYPGQELFKGTVVHSIDYRNAWDWKTKHGLIVGSANTGTGFLLDAPNSITQANFLPAHDIAEDMLDAGLSSVTMIQRGETAVLPHEHLQTSMSRLYNVDTPTPIADQMRFAVPRAVRGLLRNKALAGKDTGRYDSLEKAGFKRKQPGTKGPFRGRYVDVGTSAKIAKGLIKIKSGSFPVAYTESGLEFSDGTHLNADVIVFATGYKFNILEIVLAIFGSDIHHQVDHLWGLGSEDDLNGAYQPTGHPGLWTAGGNMGQTRYYSRFLALQIKAAVLGTPLPIDFESSHC